MSKHINDEERIFAILLILHLICYSAQAEELRDVKKKSICRFIEFDILYL